MKIFFVIKPIRKLETLLFSKKEINFFDRFVEEFLSKFRLFEFKDIEFMKFHLAKKKQS